MRFDSLGSMIYFHCIFVTLFYSGNAINLESRFMFLQDFVLHQEKPTSVVSFLASSNYDKLKLQKGMAKNYLLSMNLLDIDRPTSFQDTNYLFILDLEQDKSVDILLKAQQARLLYTPKRWIIFDDTTKYLNDSYKNDSEIVIETVKDTIEDRLKDVYLAINTEVYFAFEFENSIIHLFLAHKKRPHIQLEWELYAIWNNGFDRPRPTEVLAMRRKNMKGLNVTAVTVMANPKTIEHMPDYLYRDEDTTSKVMYYMMIHLFEWLNSTGLMNVTNSWGYRRPDGTFDGAFKEMAEERSDFSGSVFFIMKERMEFLEFVLAPSAVDVWFVFKKPSLASITNIYALPFNNHVWMSVVGLILISIVALTLASLREVFVNSSQFDVNLSQRISQSFIDTLALVFQQGIEKVPFFMSSRQILILDLLTFMFLYTAYSANVVALLQSTSNEINSVEALLNSPMQYGSQDLVYNHHIFKHETRPVHRALWLKKGLPQGDKFFLSATEGIRKVREGMYAFHIEITAGYDLIQRTFHENEKCHLGIMKYVTFSFPHFALSKKSHIKEQLRIGVFRMKENGVQSRSNRRVLAARPQCDSGAAIFTAVGLVDVAPAFMAMLVIYSLVVVVLGAEILVHYKLKKNKETDVEELKRKHRIYQN